MFLNLVTIKDVKTELGNWVRMTRKSRKLSQQKLANELEISRLTIHNLENGKNFNIDTLLKVLQYFDLLEDFNNFIVEKGKESEGIKSLY